MDLEGIAAWEQSFQCGQRLRANMAAGTRRAGRLLVASLLWQQVIAIVSFWIANCFDQLHATGVGENTATWLGGGLGFMVLIAYMQYKTVRYQPTWKNKILLSAQVLSVVGNALALGIYMYRRFSWTAADTWCAATIAVSMIGICVWYCYWRKDNAHPASLRYFFMSGWIATLLAIELRGVPRLFQGMSIFVNNPMSVWTILTGCYIAAVRLGVATLAHQASPSLVVKQSWLAELYGNTGTQVLLTVGWAIAAVI